MRKKRKLRPLLLAAVIVLAVVFLFNFYTDRRLRPILRSYAEAKGMTVATLAVNDAVCRFLEDADIAYSDLITVEYGEAGKISNIQTDASALNRIKAGLSGAIVSEMEDLSHSEVKIPLGTLIGGELFYGRGPGIGVKLIPVGGVKTDISNQFTSAGINQTRHQILFTVSVSVYIVLPSETIEKTVESEFYLAETVIVGQIPDIYVN